MQRSLALLLLCWAVAWLSCITAASGLASSASDVPLTGSLVRKKQLVVACNGFPDGESATVGVRQQSSGQDSVTRLRKVFARGRLPLDGQRVKHQLGIKPVLQAAPASSALAQLHPFTTSPGSHSLRARRTHAPSGIVHPFGQDADADVVVWSRQLAYGECEEYHVNLAKRRLFFTTPNGSATCEFEPPHMKEDAGIIQQFLVVLTSPEASSPRCTTRSAVIKKPQIKKKTGGERLVRMATVDAFTQASASQGNLTQEEVELSRREARKGLDPMAPLPQEAVVRIEDKIDDEAISSEVLASRTLGWGRTYALEPGSFHVLLEDMRGTHMPDQKDVVFKEGITYIAVRVGKAGDPMYPERLIFRRVEDALPLFSS